MPTDAAPDAARPDMAKLTSSLSPELEQLEVRRKSLRRKLIVKLSALALGYVIAVVAAFATLGPGEDTTGLTLALLFISIVGGGFLVARAQRQWRHQCLDTLVPAITEYLGQSVEYQRTVPVENYLEPFAVLDLAGTSRSQVLKHYLRGEYRGRQFESVLAELSSSSDSGGEKRQAPGFNGLLLRIQVPLNVSKALLVRPDFGLFKNGSGMEIIRTGDSEFDGKFLVSQAKDSQRSREEVTEILNDRLRRGLLAINREEGRLTNERATFQAGFKLDSIYLALSRGEVWFSIGPQKVERQRPFIEPGLLLLPSSRLKKGLAGLVDNITVIFRIIDHLESGFQS